MTISDDRVLARVDLDAIRSNFEVVRRRAPGRRIMPALKANGYGHGAVNVARALPQADAFALATVSEAAELRRAGVLQELVVLSGPACDDDLDIIQSLGLTTVVHCAEQLRLIERARQPLRFWAKLDTGMARLGLAATADSVRQVVDVATRANLELAGWLTHLACADEPGSAHTCAQIDRFDSVLAGRDEARSIANSAAVLAWPESHADWVRPGIMIYGATPFVDSPASDHGLTPAMSLHARLHATKTLPEGATVGYGATYTCPRPMRVGVVAAGYGDGLPRRLGEIGYALTDADGVPVPVIGRVSMDLMVVDLTGSRAGRGDWISLWGRSPASSVDAMATALGTIGYELLTQLGNRVQRQYERRS